MPQGLSYNLAQLFMLVLCLKEDVLKVGGQERCSSIFTVGQLTVKLGLALEKWPKE